MQWTIQVVRQRLDDIVSQHSGFCAGTPNFVVVHDGLADALSMHCVSCSSSMIVL